MPAEIHHEIYDLAQRSGDPVVRPFAVGSSALWQRRRRCEVCMVVRRFNGRLLTFTKTFYPPGLYRLLTGGVEPGETVLNALMREVDEETGLQVSISRFLAVAAYIPEDVPDPDPAACSWTCAFLLDEQDGTLAARDLNERVAGYADRDPADLLAIAHQLADLPDVYAPELHETWRDWGQYRAIIHRLVWGVLQ